MQVSKNEIIAGVDAKVLRDFLKKVGKDLIFHDSANLPWKEKSQTSTSLAELVKLGYLAPDDGGYFVADLGLRFAKANFLPPLTRDQATKLLDQVISQAETINTMPELTHYVSELHVFGSYLSDCADLGDIDIVVRLQPREGDPKKAVERSVARAIASGKRMDKFQRLFYGQEEIFKMLKRGNPQVDLCDDSVLAFADIESEPLRVCRRPFGLSYAAIAGSSSVA